MPIPKKNKLSAPKTAKERIYEALRKWIVDGTLEPGEKILDSEIAAYFSVSRTPVREAMQLLADQKLIEIFPGKGSRVSKLDRVDLRQAYRILAQLDVLAVEFAFPHITEEVIRTLKDTNRKLSAALDQHDWVAQRTFDQQFHGIFLKLAENEFLSDFMDTLYWHVARVENLYHEKLMESVDSVAEHKRIISALSCGDLEEAKKAMYFNWMNTAAILGKI